MTFRLGTKLGDLEWH